MRIASADLETLQRNLVLSHAAGVGDPMPVPIARLMMALKLCSLAQGASGVRPATINLLLAMLEKNVTPVIPAQGSVGASGDLAPLAHMAAVMIGTGEVFLRKPNASKPPPASKKPASHLSHLAPRKAWPSSTAPNSPPPTLWPPV